MLKSVTFSLFGAWMIALTLGACSDDKATPPPEGEEDTDAGSDASTAADGTTNDGNVTTDTSAQETSPADVATNDTGTDSSTTDASDANIGDAPTDSDVGDGNACIPKSVPCDTTNGASIIACVNWCVSACNKVNGTCTGVDAGVTAGFCTCP